MDRRENLKVLITGTVATGLLISSGCKEDKVGQQTSSAGSDVFVWQTLMKKRQLDNKLLAETFFTEKERKMVEILIRHHHSC
jgi:hypothetical protein